MTAATRPVPRAPVVVATVALFTLRAWFNEVSRSFGSRGAARAILAAWAAMLGLWLVIGTRQLSHVLSFDESQAAALAGPTCAVLITLPAMTTLLARLYSPSRTSLNNVLAVLPIRRAHRVAAVRWLAAGLGVVIGGVWALPIVVQLVVAAPLAHVPVLIACLAALAVTGPLVALLAFEIGVRLLGPAIGSDRVVTRALAAVATAFAIAAAFVSSMPAPSKPDGSGILVVAGERLREVVERGFAPFDVLALVAVPLVLFFALDLLDRVPGARSEDGRWALRRRSTRAHASRSLVTLEVLQWLRYPMNATLLLFSVALLISSVFVWGGRGNSDTWLTVSLVFFSLLSTVGVGSYAATRESHWAYRISARPYAWIVPKLTAALLIWVALISTAAALLWLLTPWSSGDFTPMLPILAVEFATGCVVGLLVPANREQSLSASFSESFGMVAVISVGVGLQSLPFIRSQAAFIALCAAAVAILGAIYVFAAHQRDREALATSGG